jgi:hypothetical protein
LAVYKPISTAAIPSAIHTIAVSKLTGIPHLGQPTARMHVGTRPTPDPRYPSV